MKGSIVYEFSQEEAHSPVVLLKIAENPKVMFKRLVLPLGLTISLGVKSCAKSPLGRKVPAEGAPELASEKGSPIRDDTVRKAEGPEDVLEQ